MSRRFETQTYFSFRDDREIRLDCYGGSTTSDDSLLSVHEFDRRSGFVDQIVACLDECRHPSYVRHTLTKLITQRLYRTVASCQDYNDACGLHYSGLFQLMSG